MESTPEKHIGAQRLTAFVTQYLHDFSSVIQDETIAMQQALLVMHVFTRGQVPMTDLNRLLPVEPASVTRNVRKMGPGYEGKPGLGLVRIDEDPFNGRHKIVSITPLGRAKMEKVAELTLPYFKKVFKDQ
jgi:DNA-binding MarR family transcriptional regulator